MNRLQKFLSFIAGRKDQNEKGQLDTDLIHTGSHGMGGQMFMAEGASHKVFQLLDACGLGSARIGPREWKKLSRLLYDRLSIFERAINIQASMIGGIKPAEDSNMSDSLKQGLQECIDSVPIFHELSPKIATAQGLNGFLRDIIIDILRDGEAFIQDRFEIVDDTVTDEYKGIMAFYSDNFEFEYLDGQYYLCYSSNQYPQLDADGNILDTPYFHHIAYERDRETDSGYGLHGIPMIRGGKLTSEVLIGMIVAIEAQTKRFANPMSFNVISQKDLKVYENTETKSIFTKAIKSLREKIEEGLKRMQTGRPVELVGTLPGDISLDSKLFGEGFSNFIDDDMFWKVCVLFCNTLGIPPALLGIKITGSGIGSEEFHFAYKLLVARINSMRETLRPIILQHLKTMLYAKGYGPEVEQLSIEFIQMDILSEKEKAETGEVKAKEMKIKYEIYNNLRLVDSDEGRRFAEAHGLDIAE